MYRIALLVTLIILSGCREEDDLSAYLGPYYGGFDTALTPDPSDDLNPNTCSSSAGEQACGGAHGNPLSHLLMKLDRDDAGHLTLDFYRTREDYSADRPMYLSEACRTSLWPAVEFRRHAIDDALDETQVLATARFPMRFGNDMLACTHSARFNAGPEPHMDLSLQVNPVNGASAVSITVERSRRDGNYLYVKQGGEKVPVKLDLRYVGTDDREARRVCAADDDTLLENRDGYEAVCVMTGRDQWSVVLPVSPYGPGVTAFWGSTRSPKWYRTSGEPDIVTYHKAVFLPVELGSGEMGVDD
jgi:hypothetical protein